MKLKFALVTSVAVLALIGTTSTTFAQKTTRQIGIKASQQLVATPADEEVVAIPLIVTPADDVAENDDDFRPIEDDRVADISDEEEPIIKKKKPKKLVEPEDTIEPFEVEDFADFEEEDDRPAVKKQRVAIEDEIIEDEFIEGDDEEFADLIDEDQPVVKKKKKVVVADDEDEVEVRRHRRFADDDAGCHDEVVAYEDDYYDEDEYEDEYAENDYDNEWERDHRYHKASY